MSSAPSAGGLLARLRRSAAPVSPHSAARSALAGAAALLLIGQLCVAIFAGGASRSTSPQLTPAQAKLALDPNSASAAELDLLPGIGPTRAAAIIAYRSQSPGGRAFQTVYDLDRVRGIGPATLVQIAPWIDLPGAAELIPAARLSASR